ncbi:MAG: (Fe-S)-binding protein [Desulfomonile tiedjei]|nr:(Fe-S)-binding protein [Desulfomonile tiedjei]
MTIQEPANVALAGIPAPGLAFVILVAALCLFAYIMNRRIDLLRKAMPDPRFDDIGERIRLALVYGFGQWKQPRYLVGGIIHILLFAGFMILSLRSLTLIGRGFSAEFNLPGLTGSVGMAYEVLKDYAVLMVLVVCIVAIIRRAVFKPARYAHAPGQGHEAEAYVILGMVSALMLTDMIYDGSHLAATGHTDAGLLPAATVASLFMAGSSPAALNALHIGGYWAHILIFFGFLNYLPMSKHFHVITAIPNVFFANVDKGRIKPVRHGVDEWMDLDECGITRFESFTWKHVLDFYSCADCGRCTDNCPANAVGRSLSPRMISIKARDYAYKYYPVFGTAPDPGDIKFVGDVITESEIWACTTCGACENECPILIEYIDKIVDMRRYLVDQGQVPQSLQKPMQAIKKKGNAYGGAKGKRAAWTKELDGIEVKELKAGDATDLLFFVDSCGSFDPRIQELSRSLARILAKSSTDFGILGQDETDSGNEIRRLGEEGLFEQLAQKNIAAFQDRQFKEIVAFDPHAFNAIKNDYPERFPIVHASQVIDRLIKAGRIRLSSDYLAGRVVTYHDPCYLGRHNQIYYEPRQVIQAVPGVRFRDMERSFDRSFCCSGGGVMLWYESEEEKERMGERRVRMAEQIGAQVIVTGCPFCLINLEDAVKTTGNEGKIEVIDLVELVDRSLV